MCGHVGVAGRIFKQDEQAFRNMLVLDSIRGEDSTGAAVIHKNKEVSLVKRVGDPFNVLYAKEYSAALKKPVRAIIGHNRFATMGGVSAETAHPFEFPTLVGAHNGTLKNKYKLDDSKNFTVDSENLFHHIEKNGLTNALEVIDGAWALVWWDKVAETINFLRNNERPFFMAMSEDNNTIFWASESWMLSVALSRNGVKHQAIIPLDVNTHLSIHINSNGCLSKPHIKPAPGTFVDTIWDNESYVRNGNGNHKTVHTAPNAVLPPTAKKPVLSLAHSSEKKIPETLTKEQENFVEEYLNSNRVKFEIIASQNDAYEASYISLMDLKNPSLNIRLYLKKGDPLKNMVGREIIADIGSHTMKKGEGFIFKVSPFNVVVCPEKPDKGDYLIYKGANNKLFTKKEWEERFPNCAWCFDTLFAEDHGNRITSENDCLCGKCVLLPDATEGVTLSKIY
jgi:predicted glutamine amidotransferase